MNTDHPHANEPPESSPPIGEPPERLPEVLTSLPAIDTTNGAASPDALPEITPAPPEPPASGGRWWLQFSLRWMLGATAAVAVFCAWWFRPVEMEMALGGGALVVKQQVRDVPDKGGAARQQVHGSWRLYDREESLLVGGHFSGGRPSGLWTFFDVEGRPLQEMRMHLREAASLTSFRADGSREAELTFPSGGATVVDDRPLFGTTVPAAASLYMSATEGVLRRWHTDSSLREEHRIVDKVRRGVSREFFPDGSVETEGLYRDGRREGWWQVADAAGQTPRKVYYAAGQEVAEPEQVVARLIRQMKSGRPSERATAALALEELGEIGVPPLVEALASDAQGVQLVALRVVAELPDWPHETTSRLEDLAAGNPTRASCRATCLLAKRDNTRVTKSLERLLTWVAGEDEVLAEEAAVGLVDLREHSLPMLERELSLVDPLRRRVAAKAMLAIANAAVRQGLVKYERVPTIISGPGRLYSVPVQSDFYTQLAELAQRLQSDSDDEVRRLAVEISRTVSDDLDLQFNQGGFSAFSGGGGFF